MKKNKRQKLTLNKIMQMDIVYDRQNIPQDRIPEGVPIIIGIDEAGRGPIIGHMVYGCCIVPDGMQDTISNIRDSKKTAASTRMQHYKMLTSSDSIGYVIRAVSADTIDALRSAKYTINDISIRIIIDILTDVTQQNNLFSEVIVDPVGPSDALASFLSSLFRVKISVLPKADALFPVVSAASILAKQTRENWIAIYQEDYGDLGSGYPGDPKTVKWMKVKGHRKKSIVRRTWNSPLL